jgi:hypothetical protein
MLGWIHKALARANPTATVVNTIGFCIRLADEMQKKGYDPDIVANSLGIAIFRKGDPLRPFFNPSGNVFSIDMDCWTIGELSNVKKITSLEAIVNVVQVDPEMALMLLPVYRNVKGNILDEGFLNCVTPMAHMMALDFTSRGYI